MDFLWPGRAVAVFSPPVNRGDAASVDLFTGNGFLHRALHGTIGNGFFRTIDIDDVICNFAGGAIGLVIFYITASIMRLFEHKMYKKKFWWYVSKIT